MKTPSHPNTTLYLSLCFYKDFQYAKMSVVRESSMPVTELLQAKWSVSTLQIWWKDILHQVFKKQKKKAESKNALLVSSVVNILNIHESGWSISVTSCTKPWPSKAQENLFPARKTKYDQGSLSSWKQRTPRDVKLILFFSLQKTGKLSVQLFVFCTEQIQKIVLKKWRVTLVICYKYHLFLTHPETVSTSWKVLIFLIQ